METKRLTVRLKLNLYNKLVKYADSKGLNINSSINLILSNLLNKTEDKK